VVLLLLLSGRFTIDDESASGSWKTNDCPRGEPGLAITIFSHYILFIPLSLSLSLSLSLAAVIILMEVFVWRMPRRNGPSKASIYSQEL
jgi:hypothetical protein